MKQDTFLANISRLEELLTDAQQLVEQTHPTFGRMFQFAFVPCCFPLNTVLWVNPDSGGVFLRIFFPKEFDARQTENIYSRLNEVNYSMPVGALVINSTNGQLIFQNALFIGDSVISAEMTREFLASSCDMVRYRFQELIELASGEKHHHQGD